MELVKKGLKICYKTLFVGFVSLIVMVNILLGVLVLLAHTTGWSLF